jgi:putative PIN family toxin of toxin-antitoxin system
MPAKKLKIIVDTNLWISFLISKRLQKLEALFDKDSVILVFSDELLEEFLEVASRKKFTKYFNREDIQKFLNAIDCCSETIKVKSIVKQCRDEKDNFLLALAKDSKADYLITGDEDLLIIKKFQNTEILTYSEFYLKI